MAWTAALDLIMTVQVAQDSEDAMKIERGFRRLVAVLSIAVLAVGVILGITLAEWRLIGAAGVLVALLLLGFYAVRWVAKGFTSGNA